MIRFQQQYLENFLAVVRKYMQLRGGLSQKDLAELTQTGISTMSRFLNLKTKDTDPQLAANIVAQLKIPLHEIVDFIGDDSLDTFKKLVAFYKEQVAEQEQSAEDRKEAVSNVKLSQDSHLSEKDQELVTSVGLSPHNMDPNLVESLRSLTPRQKAYVKDFLTLDGESKDLVVDIGNSLMRYFKQRGLEF